MKQNINFLKKRTQLGEEITINFQDNISLFRFRSISELTIEAFDKDQLWLSSPQTFNDPYDFSISYNKRKIKKYIETLVEENKNSFAFSKKDIINILYNYISNGFQEIVKDFRSKYYVACFSESIKEEIMWSHYASCGKGFAVEYEMKTFYQEFTPRLMGVFPVYYTDSKPLIDVLIKYDLKNRINNKKVNQRSIRKEYLSLSKEEKDELDQLNLQIVLFKKKAWKYEKEHRLVTINKDNKLNFHYNNVKPKALYLGEFISENDKERLIKIAMNKKIEVYHMQSDFTQGKNRLKYIKNT